MLNTPDSSQSGMMPPPPPPGPSRENPYDPWDRSFTPGLGREEDPWIGALFGSEEWAREAHEEHEDRDRYRRR